MSRNRTFHSTRGTIDTFDPAAEQWDTDTVEPTDFDDQRLAEKHGAAGGFFAHDTNRNDDWED